MRMRMKQRLRRATETVRLQTLTRDACWTAASTRAPTEPTADDLPQEASLSPDAVPQVFSLWDYYNCDTSTIRVRFDYDSTTIRLQHATTRYEVFRALAYEIVYENQW